MRALRNLLDLAGRVSLPGLFVFVSLPVLLLLAVLIPPGYSPDEPDHAARIGSLLHLQLLGQRGMSVAPDGSAVLTAGVTADPALVVADQAITDPAYKWYTRADFNRLLAVRWSAAPRFVPAPNTAQYAPLFYVPAAIAMAPVRLLGLPPLLAILAGRLASAVGYVLLGWFALCLAERGCLLIFAALMLPMSLWLAASLNQDGLLIATAALAAALLGRGAMVAGGMALACVMLSKPVYLPLALILLVPWRNGLELGFGIRLAWAACCVAPAVAWSLLVMQTVSTPVYLPPYHPGPLFAGDTGTVLHATDPALQLRVLLGDKLRLITLPLDALVTEGRQKFVQMIGQLGLLDVALPRPLYAAWTVAMAGAVASAVLRAPAERPAGVPVAGAVWIGIAGSLLLIYLVEYLTWTGVGATLIAGVQGRYFLPLLPFLGLGLPSLRLANPGALRTLCAVPAVALAVAGLLYLPLLTVFAFYLR